MPYHNLNWHTKLCPNFSAPSSFVFQNQIAVQTHRRTHKYIKSVQMTASRFMFLPDNSVPPLMLVCFGSLLSKQSYLTYALLHTKVLQPRTNSHTTSGMRFLSTVSKLLQKLNFSINNYFFFTQGVGIGVLTLLGIGMLTLLLNMCVCVCVCVCV